MVALSRMDRDIQNYLDYHLRAIQEENSEPRLIRYWAGAARVRLARSPEDLRKNIRLLAKYPALSRPIARQVDRFSDHRVDIAVSLLEETGGSRRLGNLGALSSVIASLTADELVNIQLTAEKNAARRAAAGLLAGRANRENGDAIIGPFLENLEFEPGAEEVPWKGGALFVPRINMDRNQARSLARTLLSWLIWAELDKDFQTQDQIMNNLRSWNLARSAGYEFRRDRPTTTRQWIRLWKDTFGPEETRKLLAEQNALDHPSFSDLFE